MARCGGACMTIKEMETFLTGMQADFQLIAQESPILSVSDAAKYYDVTKAAPTFILQNENGLLAWIVSSQYGRLDFEKIKRQFGYAKLQLADRKNIENQTGYKAEAIPLIGHGMPCLFDDTLLQSDYIYGGSGNESVTLKISPQDVKRLNNVMGALM